MHAASLGSGGIGSRAKMGPRALCSSKNTRTTPRRSSAVDMVAVDSVAALVPRAELEGEIGQTQGAWDGSSCWY